ncbi:MAG TPA: OstA-like protein [Rhodothermales bacterium]|nr:OstA-like protein [Rhodothermales bacterium]
MAKGKTAIPSSYLVLGILLGAMSIARPADAQVAPAPDSTQAKQVELSADLGEGFLVDGERVQRLSGNVRLKQGTTTLTANEAIQYPDRDEYDFSGDVRIVDEGDTLWADTVHYSSRTKVGQASPNVRLSDGEVLLRAPSGVYFVDEKRADLEGGVTMVDSASTLTSERGSYWLNEKRAEFYDHVRLEQQGSNLEADSVTYYREDEIARASGNVFIEHFGGQGEQATADTTQRVLLFGAKAYHDNKRDFSRITGNPLLVRLRADTARAPVDTLMIRAEVLESTHTDSLDRLVAIDSVRIWRGMMAAVADSAISESIQFQGADSAETRDDIRLYDDPTLWYKDLQVFGDTITATGRSGSVDSLFVTGGAFAAQRDSVTDRIRQLKGGWLLGLFEEDSLRTLVVQPNAEVIYFKRNDQGGIDGVQLSGDIVYFSFQQDELESIRWPGESEGTVYPAEAMPDPFQLEGFRWEPVRRPTKQALIDRAGRTFDEKARAPAAFTSAEGD